jgi:hypothetical protein
MVAHASSWTPEFLSRTLPRRARGAPARLKPRGLLRIQDQPLDPSVTDDMHGRPAHVPAAQARRVRRAIAGEDPLLAGPVCEVADVEIAGLVGESRWGPAGRGVLIVRDRCAGLSPLWRPPAPDRDPSRSGGHSTHPRSPGPLPLGAEPRPRPTRAHHRRALSWPAQGLEAAATPSDRAPALRDAIRSGPPAA